ncbi:uncharacterized protein VP01_15231g1 [Puccinia sorghi]|uniref:Uncharacterized protein n=1 Tax=Puccinia sorghi TaxID=27349 RepID=A0A0L6VKK1_9BASI|nr:uncharacterized protein VP01_15231g1 [Puccinia sorghi]
MAGGNCTAADPEIEPATFLAGRDPSLREAILLEQDAGFISTLPPNILAEVDAMRDRVHRQRHAIQSGQARELVHIGWHADHGCDPLSGLPVTSASTIPPASKKPPFKVESEKSCIFAQFIIGSTITLWCSCIDQANLIWIDKTWG